MELEASLRAILEEDIPASLTRFGRVLDVEWVELALQESGTATVRRRKIPAQLVVWLVIAMALFRDRSIQEVVSHLGLVLPSHKNKKGAAGETVAPSAIPQGRSRVGSGPLQLLFVRTAQSWALSAADKYRWRGLSLFGIDGTTLRIPDTEPNREAFGLPGSSRGQSAYPQIRVVGLMALRSHLLAGIALGPCKGKKTGELTLARDLWPQLPDSSLVIKDKGFTDYGLFYRLNHDEQGQLLPNRHWLIRAKSNLRWKTMKELGPGDELVELQISRKARKEDPTLPRTMVARAITYQVKGFQPQTLLTSMLDPDAYPAQEVANLYHERWEIEIGYDEIKTHMLERQEALRSKTPDGVLQETYGIMLAYNLVRKEMLDVAEEAGVDPIRISFRHCLQLIRIFCIVEAWTCAPANLPKRLTSHREMMESLLILPERRPDRRYPRHVKIKMSSYKRNPGRPTRAAK